jgi:hypothetical protein
MTDTLSCRSGTTSEKHSGDLAQSAPRRIFLHRTLAGAAVVVPGGLLAACRSSVGEVTNAATRATGQPVYAAGQPAPSLLQSIASSKLSFIEIMSDENQHVQFLQGILTSAARPRPTFQKLAQSESQAFLTLACQLEDISVGAYLLLTSLLTSSAPLLSAGSLLTIEARHAGFLNALMRRPLSSNGAFDKPVTLVDIVSIVMPFLASLNGGPDPTASLNSDEDILNLALLLEFLAAEFYKANLPAFFL